MHREDLRQTFRVEDRRLRLWGSCVGCFVVLSKRASRPPEKKNVTCGYFSVSAMRICFLPAPSRTSPMVIGKVGVVEDDVDVLELFIVFRHRQVVQIHFVHILLVRKITLCQSLRNFATTIGAEVEADDDVALLDVAYRGKPAASVIIIGWMNSSVTPAA